MKLDAYLAQTARNLAVADRRKSARRQTMTGEQSAIDGFAAEGSDPSVALQSQTRARAIRVVLEEMQNVRDRLLLVRFYLHDEDKTDICRDLKLSDEHFNRVIFRARERFRILLDKRFRRLDLM
jgi:RNA polymerase sigma-70 factor (ECF subfamily)